jgi:hypothetical protein
MDDVLAGLRSFAPDPEGPIIASSRPGVAEPLFSERSCLLAPVFSLLRLHERLRHCSVTG